MTSKLLTNALRTTNRKDGVFVGWNKMRGWSALHNVFKLMSNLPSIQNVIQKDSMNTCPKARPYDKSD